MLVWGAISQRGPSPLVIFKGRMNAEFYQNQIVGEALVPFLHAMFPTGHRFMQDNDPKHVCRYGRNVSSQLMHGLRAAI